MSRSALLSFLILLAAMPAFGQRSLRPDVPFTLAWTEKAAAAADQCRLSFRLENGSKLLRLDEMRMRILVFDRTGSCRHGETLRSRPLRPGEATSLRLVAREGCSDIHAVSIPELLCRLDGGEYRSCANAVEVVQKPPGRRQARPDPGDRAPRQRPHDPSCKLTR